MPECPICNRPVKALNRFKDKDMCRACVIESKVKLREERYEYTNEL